MLKQDWHKFFSFTLIAWAFLGANQSKAFRDIIEMKYTPNPFPLFQTINPDSFTMGSPRGEADRQMTEIQADVRITKAFDMMAEEVNQYEWFTIMGNNPSGSREAQCRNNFVRWNRVDLCPELPVVNVSWHEVQDFISKLNQKNKLTGCRGTPKDPSGCYRLPTEAEWEYAARGGNAGPYFFGNRPGSLGTYAWYGRNSERRLRPGGTRRANPYGLYDMYGNAAEWVQDRFRSINGRYITRYGGGDDPLANRPEGDRGAYRGGSYLSRPGQLRSASRLFMDLDDKRSSIGFRLVRTR